MLGFVLSVVSIRARSALLLRSAAIVSTDRPVSSFQTLGQSCEPVLVASDQDQVVAAFSQAIGVNRAHARGGAGDECRPLRFSGAHISTVGETDAVPLGSHPRGTRIKLNELCSGLRP